MNRLSKFKKIVLLILATVLTIGALTVFIVHKTYNNNLNPISTSQKSQSIVVESGASVREIAELLESEGLVRKAWAFEWYVRSNNAWDALLAGTYSIRPSMSVEEIVGVISQGKIATDLVTILPGQRIDQVRQSLINDYGFNPSDVDKALEPSNFMGHPALVDKPAGANLEGYLFPESFQRSSNTDVVDILRLSLNEMSKVLTPEVRAGIASHGLSVHQGVILASIVGLEIGHHDPAEDLSDKRKVAQVFLSRLSQGIALESDATSDYGAVLDDAELVLGYSSPYNTYENKGLTPTPISNVTKNSLLAVSNPTKTDYLFFVTGKDCKTRFSRTVQEHDALKAKHGISQKNEACE